MLRGLYTSAGGMMTQMARQGITSNNLSNATTTGFKQDVTAQRIFSQMMMSRVQRADGALGEMTAVAPEIGPLVTTAGALGPRTDFAQGALTDTGGAFDLALTGPGFFQVQTPDGVQLTRDGSFSRDAQGRLVASDGAPVIGNNGPITLPEGEVVVTIDGQIAVNSQVVGQLRLVNLAPDQLVKAGHNRYRPGAGSNLAPAPTVAVHQGFLESSNVDLARAITDMMTTSRAYEASQRMLQLQDDLLGKAVNELGRVG